MKNVTISLPDELAKKVRVWAVEQDMSLSKFLAGMIRERDGKDAAYWEAYARFRSMKPVELSDGNTPYPKREELYDRKCLR